MSWIRRLDDFQSSIIFVQAHWEQEWVTRPKRQTPTVPPMPGTSRVTIVCCEFSCELDAAALSDRPNSSRVRLSQPSNETTDSHITRKTAEAVSDRYSGTFRDAGRADSYPSKSRGAQPYLRAFRIPAAVRLNVWVSQSLCSGMDGSAARDHQRGPELRDRDVELHNSTASTRRPSKGYTRR